MIKKMFLILLFLTGFVFSQTKTTQVGVDLIKYYEGFRGKAYLCPANVLTIGYGSTGNHVYSGLVITKFEAERLLKNDLERFENYVNRVTERRLRWHEFDALISFTFNVGYRLKNELLSGINRGNTKLVVMKVMQYNKAKVNGSYIILKGLLTRRRSETALYENNFQSAFLKSII